MSFNKNCPQCNSQCDYDAVLCVNCGHFFNDENANKARIRKEENKKGVAKALFKYRLKQAAVVLLCLGLVGYGVTNFFYPSNINTKITVKEVKVPQSTLKRHFYRTLKASSYWNDAKKPFNDEDFTCELELKRGNYNQGLILDIQMTFTGRQLYKASIFQPRSKEDLHYEISDALDLIIYKDLIDKQLKAAAEDIGKQLELIRLFKFSNEKMLNLKFLNGLIKYQNIAASYHAPDWGKKYVWDYLNDTELKLRSKVEKKFVMGLIASGMDEKNDERLMRYITKNSCDELITERLKYEDTDRFLKQGAVKMPGWIKKYVKELPIEMLIDHHYYRKELHTSKEAIRRYEEREAFAKIKKEFDGFRKYLVIPYFKDNNSLNSLQRIFDRIKVDGNKFLNTYFLEDLISIAGLKEFEKDKTTILTRIFSIVSNLKDEKQKKQIIEFYTSKYDIDEAVSETITKIRNNEK